MVGCEQLFVVGRCKRPHSQELLTACVLLWLWRSHTQVSGALATVLVGERKTSPASETKPGKPPRVSFFFFRKVSPGVWRAQGVDSSQWDMSQGALESPC